MEPERKRERVRGIPDVHRPTQRWAFFVAATRGTAERARKMTKTRNGKGVLSMRAVVGAMAVCGLLL